MALTPSSSTSGGTQSLVLVSDSVLGVDTATFDIQAIAQTYKALRLVIDARSTKAATSGNMLLRFNNDSGANYDYQLLDANGAATFGQEGLAQTSIFLGDLPAATAPAGRSGLLEAIIANYASTTLDKNVRAYGGMARATTTTNIFCENSFGTWRSTAAVSRITVLPDSGNFLTGSRCTLWGMT